MSTIIDSQASNQSADMTAREACSLVQQIIDTHQADGFSVDAVLKEHPELKKFRLCVIELALEEYVRRREAGEEIVTADFVGEFSQIQQSLFRVIELDEALREFPEIIQGVPEERWPETGDIFCDFELEELIGRGAVSRVFVARQVELRRRVVLKVCVRGEHEAALLGQLAFDGIVPIHSIHVEPATGLTAICMPYLTRVTMHELAEILVAPESLPEISTDSSVTGGFVQSCILRLNSLGGLDARDAENSIGQNRFGTCQANDSFSTLILKWGIQLSKALEFAHASDILHCDVKPGNVLVTSDLSAKLLDFNLASADGEAIRWAGGTLPYMASEQLHFLAESFNSDSTPETLPNVSTATDIFGLCATVWYVATGEPPFGDVEHCSTRSQAASLLLERQTAGIDAKRIEAAERVLPADALALLKQGLSFSPDDRPNNVGEFAASLAECLPTETQDSKRNSHFPRWFLVPVLMTLTALLLVAIFRPPNNIGHDDILQTAIADSIKLCHQRKFEDARILVKKYLNQSASCRFIDVYCRTCELDVCPIETGDVSWRRGRESVGSSIGPAKSEHASDDITSLWAAVTNEWHQLTKVADQTLNSAAWFNLSCVYLERQKFDSAVDSFANVDSTRLPASDVARLKASLDIINGDDSDLEQSLKELRTLAGESVTLGELLIVAEGTARLMERSKSELSTAQMVSILDGLLATLQNCQFADRVILQKLMMRISKLDVDRRLSARVALAVSAIERKSSTSNLKHMLVSPEAIRGSEIELASLAD